MITVSKGIAGEIISKGRIRPAAIETIYNPFELERIAKQATMPAEGIPKGDYMVHVGRFARQKRHDILFQALTRMKHNLPLVLLCNNKKKALKVAKKYGVEDRLILPGFQANPFPWIKRAKLLVLSSDYEGLGNVLIEALALNTPVVSSNCDHGPSEILTGELQHYLVPRRDPQALAERLDWALDSYPDCSEAEILTQVAALTVAQKYLALIE